MANSSHVDAVTALDELFGAIDKYRTSEGFQELLAFLQKLPTVGPYNALLLHIQRPGASYVATVGGWAKLGRTVRRDAHPLVTLRAFGPVEFVYDVEDTTGADLPADILHPFRTTGHLASGVVERTERHAQRDGIAICQLPFGCGLAGRVSGQLSNRKIIRLATGEVALLVIDLAIRLTPPERFATLVHELAHVYCGHLGTAPGVWWPNRTDVDHRSREFEAEAVAWIVCARKGLDPGSYRYLQGFLKPYATLPEISLNQIMVAANYIEALASAKPANKKQQTPVGGASPGRCPRTPVNRTYLTTI